VVPVRRPLSVSAHPVPPGPQGGQLPAGLGWSPRAPSSRPDPGPPAAGDRRATLQGLDAGARRDNFTSAGLRGPGCGQESRWPDGFGAKDAGVLLEHSSTRGGAMSETVIGSTDTTSPRTHSSGPARGERLRKCNVDPRQASARRPHGRMLGTVLFTRHRDPSRLNSGLTSRPQVHCHNT
jgi:hypothetical protein